MSSKDWAASLAADEIISGGIKMDALSKIEAAAKTADDFFYDETHENHADFASEVVTRDPTAAISGLNEMIANAAFLARDLAGEWKRQQARMIYVSVALPDETRAALDRVVELNGETIDDVFRRAVKDYIAEHKAVMA